MRYAPISTRRCLVSSLRCVARPSSLVVSQYAGRRLGQEDQSEGWARWSSRGLQRSDCQAHSDGGNSAVLHARCNAASGDLVAFWLLNSHSLWNPRIAFKVWLQNLSREKEFRFSSSRIKEKVSNCCREQFDLEKNEGNQIFSYIQSPFVKK